MLDPRRLHTFARVIEHGSFAAAAESLNFAPSAVSQQMAALERELGTALFDRTRSGARLTGSGRVLADHLASIDTALNEAEAAVRNVGDLVFGVLRVAAFPSALVSLVPRALADFGRVHPAVGSAIVEAEPGRARELLRTNVVDLAVVYQYDETVAAREDGLVHHRLLTDPMQLLVHEKHHLAGREQVEMVDLAGEHWIAGHPESPGTQMTRALCRRAGFEPDVRFATEDYLVMRQLVSFGLGVAFVPAVMMTPAPGLRICPINDAQPVRTISALHRQGPPSATVMAGLEYLSHASQRTAALVTET